MNVTYTKSGTMAYQLHTIETKQFKKAVVRVNFRNKMDKESITYRSLLCEVLLESSKKYPSLRDMNLKVEDLYDASVAYNQSQIGSDIVTSFELTFLSDKYTEIGNGKNAITFLSDILFDPNVDNEKFNHDSFEKCKAFLKEKISAVQDNPNYLANKGFFETIFKGTELQYIGPGYLEDLEKIDENSLYEYYKKMIHSDTVDIFVCSDMSSDMIEELVKQSFPINTVKRKLSPMFVEHKKFRKRSRMTTDRKEQLKQSVLIVGALVENMTDFERNYVGSLYNYILGGGSNSLLFQEVREKNSLCYVIHSNLAKVMQLLTIRSGIDASNYKKAITVIKKQLKKMQTGDFDEQHIENFKMVFRSSREEMQDSVYSLINFYQAHEYTNMDLNEVALKEIEKLNKEMVMDFAKKIHLDTIYFLEGGNIRE